MTSAQFDMNAEPQPGRSAKLETAVWGLFFIWVGVCLLADFSWAVFFFGTGVLMLGSQALRRYVGLRVDRFSLAMGTCFVVVGGIRGLGWHIGEVTMPAWFVPALFIGVGIAFVVAAWRRWPHS